MSESAPKTPRNLPASTSTTKGQRYEVFGCARHTETNEEFVVYRALYGDHDLWVRPKAMFLETVIVDGREVPRFRLVGSENTPSG